MTPSNFIVSLGVILAPHPTLSPLPPRLAPRWCLLGATTLRFHLFITLVHLVGGMVHEVARPY